MENLNLQKMMVAQYGGKLQFLSNKTKHVLSKIKKWREANKRKNANRRILKKKGITIKN